MPYDEVKALRVEYEAAVEFASGLTDPAEQMLANMDTEAKFLLMNQALGRQGITGYQEEEPSEPELSDEVSFQDLVDQFVPEPDHREAPLQEAPAVMSFSKTATSEPRRVSTYAARVAPVNNSPSKIPKEYLLAEAAAEPADAELPAHEGMTMHTRAGYEPNVEDYVRGRISIAQLLLPQNHAELRKFKATIAELADMNGLPSREQERFFTAQRLANRIAS